MRQVVRYTAMLLRAYVRDRSAVFFSLLLPLMFMLIFGALNLGAFGHVTMGIVDEARNADSRRFVDQLAGIGELTVREGALDDEKARLSRSERDMVVAIPGRLPPRAPAAGRERPDPARVRERRTSPAGRGGPGDPPAADR